MQQRIQQFQQASRGPAVWPGRLTLLLVLVVVIGSGVWAARHGERVAAESRAVRVAQTVPLATQPPTPTVTRTPAPAVDRAAARSPLATPTGSVTAPPSFTSAVPLPPVAVVPHLAPDAAPVGIVAATVLTTGLITELVPGLTIDVPTLTPTPTAAVVLLLPTPTPSPTLTIGEALAQPVASSGGLAGIVAAVTATAVAPTVAPAPAEVAIEVTVTDAAASGLQGEGEAAPQPTLLPQPTADSTVRTVRVPILMYHYLSVPPADADIYRRDLSVTPDLFAAHLDAMQGAGYTPISLYALIDHLTQGAPLPAKPVVLTFDDGYRDNYENAFPRLRDRGMTATFFIVTDFIDGQRPEYLTWEMVREMYAGGMSIEAHGRNHVSLKNKDQDYLIWQALGSLETIQFELGVRPHFVSYPAGEYDQATIDIFRSANYWAGFTTIQGATHSSDDLFQLRRVRVRGTTEPAELLRLLALDW